MSTETLCETEPDSLTGIQRLRQLFEARVPTAPAGSTPQPNRADMRRFGATSARDVRHGSRAARRLLGRPVAKLATHAFTLKVLPATAVAAAELDDQGYLAYRDEAVYVAYRDEVANWALAVRDRVREYLAEHPGAQVLGIGDDRKPQKDAA